MSMCVDVTYVLSCDISALHRTLAHAWVRWAKGAASGTVADQWAIVQKYPMQTVAKLTVVGARLKKSSAHVQTLTDSSGKQDKRGERL